ncbi:hypothetical protein [Streptomyces iconiensis]|uniref:PH domain-containing protein n=1 Tax=Streptomyces iconiensis TaxID=1384038 RepID=A0ABT6ZZW7_9ACTN|nr:hypothetical protein [Streptomyces iconiensis]MDJ1134382.1 hypothetical protein [Streptomyces iconiensis]
MEHSYGSRCGERVEDPRWVTEVRWVGVGGAVVLGTLLAVDAGYGRLTWPRCALWAGLALLLCLVLLPPRITAGRGWIASRGVLVERRVRTDRLVAFHWDEGSGGAVRRVILHDTAGTRLELDVGVLTATPALWLLLEEGAREALRNGTLTRGSAALTRLANRVEQETVRAVLMASGLEETPRRLG